MASANWNPCWNETELAVYVKTCWWLHTVLDKWGSNFALLNILIGVLGNVLTLLIFKKMMGQSKPYVHQISIISLDLFDCFVMIGMYLSDNVFKVFPNRGSAWVQNSPLLLLLCYWVFPMSSILSLTRQVLLNLITIDRIQAIEIPVKYQHKKHTKRALAFLGISLLLGFAPSFNDFFLFTVVHKNESARFLDRAGEFRLVPNGNHSNLLIVQAMELLRIILRISLRVVLIVTLAYLSLRLLQCYQKMMKNRVGRIERTDGNRLVDVKTLAKLLLAQSLLTSLAQTVPLMAFYAIVFLTQIGPTHIAQGYMGKIFFITASAVPGYNFLIYFALSGEFRRFFWMLVGRKGTVGNQNNPAAGLEEPRGTGFRRRRWVASQEAPGPAVIDTNPV